MKNKGDDISLFKEVMEYNTLFLSNKAFESFREILDLTNDTQNLMDTPFQEQDVNKIQEKFLSMINSEWGESSISFFYYHILIPHSYSLYLNLLTGNLPMCFVGLRFMHESLMKCYFADVKYPNKSIREKNKLLDKERKEKRKSITTLMGELDEELGTEKEFKDIWCEISNKWCHPDGIMDTLMERAKDKNLPSWTFMIPMKYNKEDLRDIEELREYVSRFRELLGLIIKKYNTSI